jgi:3-methyladenine DNA glycosylase AlkD
VSDSAANLLSALGRRFESARDEAKAAGMSRYMRNLFPYYGIPAPVQRQIFREVLTGAATPTEHELRSVARACWKRPEREWQYFACGYLRRHVRVASPGFLPTVGYLVTTKSWWDTVDSLAAHTTGSLVTTWPELADAMDEWIASDNIWLARTAILHQLGYKSATDADRLFSHCLRRAGDPEFFVRKAIGWALREYSKTDGPAVRRFVRDHRSELSGLSQREGLKWLERGGRTPRARKSAGRSI